MAFECGESDTLHLSSGMVSGLDSDDLFKRLLQNVHGRTAGIVAPIGLRLRRIREGALVPGLDVGRSIGLAHVLLLFMIATIATARIATRSPRCL